MWSVECGVTDWAPPSDAAEKEDCLYLCTVLPDINSGVMLHTFLVF